MKDLTVKEYRDFMFRECFKNDQVLDDGECITVKRIVSLRDGTTEEIEMSHSFVRTIDNNILTERSQNLIIKGIRAYERGLNHKFWLMLVKKYVK